MIKGQLFVLNVFEKITKISIYILVFLMPIFFLSWTSDALDFNKQALFVLLVFISLFAWMIKTVFVRTFTINKSKVNIAIGILLLVYLASMIFSVSMYGSFWGWPEITSESLLSIIGFVMLYFLVSNCFSEKEIFTSCTLLTCSAGLALIYGILQMIGLNIIPFSFAKNTVFNTIGSVGSLGFFAATLLPLFIVISIIAKKWWKALFLVNIVLTFIVLLLINYNLMWLMVLAGSVLIVAFWIIKRNVFDGRWMFLPIFFIIVSLFFVIFSPQVKWLPQNFLEISVSKKANVAIDVKALQSSPILGSGPGTFSYDFSKYRDKNFNENSFWNLHFNLGASKVLTSLATVGMLGFLALLSVMFLPIFYGVKYLIFNTLNFDMPILKSLKTVSPNVTEDFKRSKSKVTMQKTSLIVAVLIVLIVETFGFFLYNSNVVMDFVYFFSIGCLMALISKDNKTYILKPSSLLTLAVTFIFTLVFIFGLGFLMLEGQRYLAEINYYRALSAFNNGQKDNAIKYVKIAASNNANLDLYFRQLASFSLSKLQDELFSPQGNISEEEKKKNITALVSDSINASNIAVNIGPKNVDNWSMKGYVCQNLAGFITDAVECAIKSYDEAIILDPFNVYLLVQEGNVYLAEAANLPQDQLQNKNRLLSQAQDKFNKAIDLKKDYSLAYFQKALASRLQQNVAEEANALDNAEKYSPNDAGLALQIGLVYYQDKNWQKAQAEFQRALSILPNYTNALYYLGLTYDQQGQKDNAIHVFSKVLHSNPNNKNIQKILDNLKNNKVPLDGLTQQSATINK